MTAIATARDTVALFLGNAVARICALVAVVIVARTLPQAEVAVVLVGQAVVAYLVIAMDFGLTPTAISMAARRAEPSGVLLGAVLTLRSTIALLGLAVIVGAVLLLGLPSQQAIVIVLYAAAAGLAALDATWLPQAVRSAVPRGALTASVGMLGLVLLVVLFAADPRPEAAPAALLVASAALVPWWLVAVVRRHGPVRTPPIRLLRGLLAFALPLGVSSLLAQVYYNFDLLFMAAVRPPAEVATYGSVYRVVLGLQMLPLAFASVSLSRYAAAHASGAQPYERLTRRNVRLLSAIALPLAVGGTILAPQIVEALFGPAYAPGAGPLAVLMWAVALAYVHSTLIAALSAVGRGWAVTRAIGVATIVNVGLNVALIPSVGMLGAAAATVAAEAVVLGLILAQRAGLPSVRSILSAVVAPVIPVALMALALGVLLVIAPGLALVVEIGVGAGVYAIASIAFGGWADEDRRLAVDVLTGLRARVRR